MKPQCHGLLSLVVLFVASSAGVTFAADKVDYSLTADKWIQLNEPYWNPRAGLSFSSDVVEVESNDTCPGQSVSCGTNLIGGTLPPGDVDYISFDAVAGEVLFLGTDSAGGLDVDTKLTLLAACGSSVAFDDDSGPGGYSLITYLVPTTGSYTLCIEAIHPALAGDYTAFVACQPRDPADLCSTAPALPAGAFVIDSTTLGTTNDYDLTDGTQNECTGFATAGSDVVYVIDYPSFSLNVTYTSDVDGSIYLVTDCNNPRNNCVAGSDRTVEGEPETITYTATTPGPYYLILDNFAGDEGPAGDFTLVGYLDVPPTDWVNEGGFANSGLGLGAAWGDFDGDFDVDVYLSKYGEPNTLMRNNGGFSVASIAVLNDGGNGRGVTWGDYDNDGDLDLYLSNGFTENKLFKNDGFGGFTEVTGSPVNNTGDGRGVAWVDYDNDGDLDLYLANASPNHLFENDGLGGFTDVTTAPLDDEGIGSGVAWADYDGDGDQDLYLANFSGPNKLIRNDGDGVFTDVTTAPMDDPGDGRGAAWADYDNDGDLDLYLTNGVGANKLFRNEGGDVFTDVTTPMLGGGAGDSRGVAWGDVDNDGDLDLFVTNVLEPNFLYRNEGDGTFVDATPAELSGGVSGQGVAMADYDSDGDLDLYIANALSFDKILRNDLPAGNHWLHVDLVGATSNRSAIGARVRIVAGGKTQIREVSGGSGYMSQNSLTVEFGLGSATSVDTLEIFWPGGVKTDSTNVAVDQRILISEEDLTVDAGDVPIPQRLTLLSNVPDPFNPSTEIRYALPSRTAVRITIYDARGRLVRSLFHGTQDAGIHGIKWNGTDDSGASLASGTYVARISSVHGSDTEKLTLLK